MWRRVVGGGREGEARASESGSPTRDARRAYYRVGGWLPIRLTPLAPEAVAAAVLDLSLPELERVIPLSAEPDEHAALLARLHRIEEKLDRLLGAAAGEGARTLSGRDRRFVTFSGTGLALDVDFHFHFRRGDAFRIDLLLPAPQSRVIRAVAEAVEDAPIAPREGRPNRLALAFRHIEADERDALIAHSYEIQRVALRAKHEGAAARP